MFWTPQPDGIYPFMLTTLGTPTSILSTRLLSNIYNLCSHFQMISGISMFSITRIWWHEGNEGMYVVVPSVEKISYLPPLEFIYWDGWVSSTCLGHTVFRKLIQIVMWNSSKGTHVKYTYFN